MVSCFGGGGGGGGRWLGTMVPGNAVRGGLGTVIWAPWYRGTL